jgi:hypothetical protein
VGQLERDILHGEIKKAIGTEAGSYFKERVDRTRESGASGSHGSSRASECDERKETMRMHSY